MYSCQRHPEVRTRSLGVTVLVVLATCVVALTTMVQGQEKPTFSDRNVQDYRDRIVRDFLARPQMIARLSASSSDTPEGDQHDVFRNALTGALGQGFGHGRRSPADAAASFADYRVLKRFANGESLVTFDIRLRDVAPGMTSESTDLAPAFQSLQKTLQTLTQHPSAMWVEPVFGDYFLTALTPNDPFFNTTGAWGQSYLDLWGLQQIGAPTAWDTTTGDEELIIGIVDSGIDYTHPDLHRNMWVNPAEVADVNADLTVDIYDIDTNQDGQLSAAELAAVNNGFDDGLAGHTPNGRIDDIFGFDFYDGDATARDFHGHGTHIAGTIGATGNNGIGVVGINWRCKMLAAKAFSDTAGSNTLALTEAIMYAVDEGAKILNCSWGSLVESQAILDAIAYAYDQGAVVVFASGNFGIDSQYVFPNSDRTLTVNASSEIDTLTIFSNFGIRSDVAAPGGGSTSDPLEVRNILSTLASGSFFTSALTGYHVATDYIRIAGTSMAAPHAAGTLGLLFAESPGLTVEEARQVLRVSAADHGAAGWDPQFGYGRVDAAAALLVTNPAECHISSPASGIRRDQLLNPSQLQIVGTARSLTDPLTQYRVDYREIGSSSWIQIQDWVAAPVVDASLATWDTTALADANYEVRVQLEDSLARVFEDRIGFSVPLPPMAGWPLAFTGDTNNFGSPILDDLNSDGVSELVLPVGGVLHVLDAGGMAVPGWPLDTASFGASGFFSGTPVSGDFDPGYAGREIVAAHSVSGTVNVNVYHADGTRRTDQNWPLQLPGGSTPRLSPALADLNQNGSLELVIYIQNRIHIFNQQGVDITPAALAAEVVTHTADGSKMAVGDINGDSLPEIVFVRRPALTDFDILAYDINGQLVLDIDITTLMTPLVTPLPARFSVSALCLADLDDDPDLEVVAVIDNEEPATGNGFLFRDQEVIALNGDGTFVAGNWPAHVDPSGVTQLFPGILSYVLAGDIDSDGHNEIVAATLNQLTVLRADGSEFGNTFLGLEFESPPVAGDLNGTSATHELIGSSLFGSVFGFQLDGTQVDGFPLGSASNSSFLTTSPAMGDLDGDGLLELVVKEPGLGFPLPLLYVSAYDVNGSGAVWPMYRGMPEGRNAVEGCFGAGCGVSPDFLRGDCNTDGGQDIADAVKILAFLFPVGAPAALPCRDACDANDDGSLNVADAVRLLTALFGMPSVPLPAPYTACGPDLSNGDPLDCLVYSSCP